MEFNNRGLTGGNK